LVSISVDRLLESVDTLDEFDLDEIEPTRVMSSFEDGFFFADRFKIDEVLGSGGMGTVYDAHDMQTGHRVALKVLKKTKSSGESEDRFRREAEILASIDHPGIVGIHGFGAAPDGTLWLAMEYLEGVTLREKVSRDGPMDPAELCPIITAACAALSETHARGVVHRDLKPDNIFLTSSTPPEVKILDFGLSLTLTSKKLTATGTIIGTPRYMAPEQIKSAHAAGPSGRRLRAGSHRLRVLGGAVAVRGQRPRPALGRHPDRAHPAPRGAQAGLPRGARCLPEEGHLAGRRRALRHPRGLRHRLRGRGLHPRGAQRHPCAEGRAGQAHGPRGLSGR
jgi:hypothetical protein